MTAVDIVSDLHQDYWDLRLNLRHPSGIRSHVPFEINPTSGTNILIVAGDISDSIGFSLDSLRLWKQHYKHILFVDGNHEHFHIIPKMYSPHAIGREMSKPEYKDIHYLPTQPFVLNGIAFVGVSGWWNYCGTTETQTQKYLPHLTQREDQEFKIFVISQAFADYSYLRQMLDQFEEDPRVEKVVVVTHSVPVKSCTQKRPTELNELMEYLVQDEKIQKNYHIGSLVILIPRTIESKMVLD